MLFGKNYKNSKKEKYFGEKEKKKCFGDKLTSLCAKYLIVSVIFTCLYNSRMYKEKNKISIKRKAKNCMISEKSRERCFADLPSI